MPVRSKRNRVGTATMPPKARAVGPSAIAQRSCGLSLAVVARTCLSPADLQRANPNFHHGDPYGGSLALDQNFLWRPFAASPGHRTPVDRLWHIGASTWPGPGLGAGSGTLVARELLRPAPGERLRQRFRKSS